MATALELKNLLSRYAGSGNDFYQRLSLVTERLLKISNSRARDLVTFVVYPDSLNQGFITLPRQYTNIMAADVDWTTTAGRTYGMPIPVQNSWYQYIYGGIGMGCQSFSDGVIPIPGTFTTFATWSSSMKLRFKFATTETGDKIIVRGRFQGAPIYSTNSQGNWIEGLEVAYTGANVDTGTVVFDEPPYAIIKPVTIGVVSMYTVDTNNVETLVALYDPGETYPQLRRYKVPVYPANAANASPTPTTFSCVCKRAFTIILNDYDEPPISNYGAIEMGLRAKLKEDAEDYVRAKQLWQEAKEILANESDDDTGPAAQGSVAVDDDFGMAALDCGYMGGG